MTCGASRRSASPDKQIDTDSTPCEAISPWRGRETMPIVFVLSMTGAMASLTERRMTLAVHCRVGGTCFLYPKLRILLS